jgi:outer membrane protein OmpA-like peptidoglycan-associated protein
MVLSRKQEALFDYKPPVLTPSDTGIVADSINKAYKNGVVSYMTHAMKIFDTMEVNKIIDKGFYPELAKATHLFDAELGKEYLVYAFDKSDTAVFTFTTKPEERTFYNTYSYDTSDVNASVNNAKKIDLISVDLFIDKKPPVVDTTPVVLIEDEKVFTVAKLIEDNKSASKKDLKVILNYDFDDANFIRDHASSLDSMVTFLKQYPELNVMITAHTDSKGSDRYNQELSKRRAKSIEDYFQKSGIEKRRMKSKGMGESEPKVPNENSDGSDNEEGRRINRRAEIVIEE